MVPCHLKQSAMSEMTSLHEFELFSFVYFLYIFALYACLGLTGLYLAPLDGIKICGFVFPCRATEWTSLLLNLAAYALTIHICISILALSQISEHGPLPLKQSAMSGMTSLHEFELTLLMYHCTWLPEAITVCIIWGRIATLSKCYIWVTHFPKSRKNVVFPSIPPSDPWSDLWESVCNLLQSFLPVIVLSNSSDRTHFVTNAFKHIFVTVTNL